MGKENEIQEKIDRQISNWQVPFDEYAHAKSKMLVMQRISEGSAKTKMHQKRSEPLNRWVLLRVAAIIIILVGIGLAFVLTGNQFIENSSSDNKTVLLPDGSSVLLTPKSTLGYNSRLWRWDRTAQFSGEGYFEVRTGSTFTVETVSGNVEVLGTSFTVWSDDKDFFTHCNTGSVRIKSNNKEVIIGKNEFLDIEDGVMSSPMVYKSSGFIAPRQERVLKFESVPVAIVLNELEIVLGLKIKNELPSNLVYSGILDVSDVNQCFEVFCKPFGAVMDKKSDYQLSIHL